MKRLAAACVDWIEEWGPTLILILFVLFFLALGRGSLPAYGS